MTADRPIAWFDNDAYWRTLYPFMFPASRLAEAAMRVDQFLSLTRPPGHRALDLCCGPGRWAVALATRGFTVTGVDRTPFLLSKARDRAAAAEVEVEWIRQDMRDFVRPDAFDLAINMFTSFGYFDDREEDLAVLRNMLASLRPGGVGVVDVAGKEVLARIYRETAATELADGTVLVQRHEIIDNWTRLRNVWTVIQDDRARSFEFRLRLYSGQELHDLFERAGFSRIRLYGDLEGAPYGIESERLIVTGSRP